MKTAQAKESIKKIVDNCIGISVFFVDSGNNIYDSDVNNESLDDFRKEFVNGMKKKYTNNESFTCPPLSNYDDRKHTLYHFDFDEMPYEFSLIDKVEALKANERLEVYQAKNHGLKTLKAFIIRLRNTDGMTMCFYQNIHHSSMWKSDRKTFLTTHNTRVVKLTDDVLRLTDSFVVAKLNNNYYIENVTTLEKELSFSDIIHAKASKNLSILKSMDIVECLDSFSQRITNDTSFARKFVKVYRHSPVIEKKLENKSIIEFAMSKSFYKEKLKLNESGDKFDISTIGRCNHFLTLLDDNFVKSELTGEEYISKSKDKASKAG
ncbi:anti-phage protein KwaB [Enterovibrio norvegicus]|uniref:anti-phage protein KwaB n=1 Tax=Enterovibrio norvegicus TaxID=188144 RepID=UPI000C82A197|nr:anti-phage protein KwaB [Enterovibrio norvegicus]PMN65656.1 hypothetical protein BCT27_09595 [Enterovibrio norvegicus]